MHSMKHCHGSSVIRLLIGSPGWAIAQWPFTCLNSSAKVQAHSAFASSKAHGDRFAFAAFRSSRCRWHASRTHLHASTLPATTPLA